MKLRISKKFIIALPLIGIASLVVYTFSGDMYTGWLYFVASLFLSGLINLIFFRCPACKECIPANSTLNQKFCPLCGEDLGLKDSGFGYYAKCKVDKNGKLRAYTISGFIGFFISVFILLLIVVALFGFSYLYKGSGRYVTLAILAIGLFIGFMCRLIVGSSARLDDKYLYYCKIPGRWRRFELEDIRAQAKEHEPYYHATRGYVMATSDRIVAIPVATYKGGEEFLAKLTESIGQDMVDIIPEFVESKRTPGARADEIIFQELIDELFPKKKKDEEDE